MKKISLFLLVVLMVSLLAVSVSAETITIGEHVVPVTIQHQDGTVSQIEDFQNTVSSDDTLLILKSATTAQYIFYFIPDSRVMVYDNYFRLRNSPQTISMYRYYPDNADIHFVYSNDNSTSNIGLLRDFTFVWCSHDISDSSGNVRYAGSNFPVTPLWETIQGVTVEEVETKTLPQVGGTMNILLLCGVGLMALLVVLKLFGKRSLIYRS